MTRRARRSRTAAPGSTTSAGVVAEPGRRLQRATSWIAIIGVGLIVAWWVYNTFLVPMFGLPPILSE